MDRILHADPERDTERFYCCCFRGCQTYTIDPVNVLDTTEAVAARSRHSEITDFRRNDGLPVLSVK